MRSIGKRNIKKLQTIVAEEMTRGRQLGYTPAQIKGCIEARIPAEWYDIWESAWSEIERIVDDEVWRVINTR